MRRSGTDSHDQQPGDSGDDTTESTRDEPDGSGTNGQPGVRNMAPDGSGTNGQPDGHGTSGDDSTDRRMRSTGPGEEQPNEGQRAPTDGDQKHRSAIDRHDPAVGETGETGADGEDDRESSRENSGEPGQDDNGEYDQDNVAGALARDQPLEPQRIDRENAAFVLLGIVLTVAFLLRAIQGL